MSSKEYFREYYKKNRKRLLEQVKKYQQKPESQRKIREYARKKWIEKAKNPKFMEQERKRCQKYYHENKEKSLNSTRQWRKNNIKKYKSHWIVAKIPMEKRCSYCGSNNKLERHHPNYNLPKDFITLCRTCHKKIHRKQFK